MNKKHITLHHIKLYEPTNTKKQKLKKLYKSWNKAIRSALKIVKRWGFTSYTRAHDHIYHLTRHNFNLPAQVANEVNRKAVRTYKSTDKKYRDKVSFNRNIEVNLVNNRGFKLISKTNGTYIAKIPTEGRKSIYCPVCLSQYHLEKLNNDKFQLKTAKLYQVNNEWYLNFILEYEVELKNTDTYLGIDLGIVNLATFSVLDQQENILHTEHISGKELRFKRMRYKQKRKYKAKKTGSINTSKIKENRLCRQTNWLIANKIIEIAKKYNSTIVFEDLKNIRKYITNNNKLNNYEKNSWAYYQLKQLVKHKADLNDLPVKEVNPSDTSQICSKCGVRGIRKKQDLFECSNGHKLNADSNASINIAKLGMGLDIEDPFVNVA